MKTPQNRTPFIALALAGMVALLSACASPAGSKKEDMTGVGIHSLNYSAREVSMIGVTLPGKPGQGGGGDALNPYGEGGLICCFAVPSKWRPDFKVLIEYQFYPEKGLRRAEVNLPRYPNDIVGDIWLIVHDDESVEAVVSNYGPDRAEWPGMVKGYPVPSREYRLKRWEEKMLQEKTALARFEKALGNPDISEEKSNSYQETIQQIKDGIQYLERIKP